MKVLTVYRTYFPDPPGGMQEAIRQICRATSAHGVQNTIFTLSPQPVPARLLLPEAEVVRCRSWAAPASCDLGGLDAFRTFRQLAREADVVHYFFPWPFADLLHRFCGCDTPAVLSYVSDIVRQRYLGLAYAPLMRRTLADMRAIVANAPSYIGSSTVLSGEVARDKIHVIPLGIDESSYPAHGDNEVFNRIGLDRSAPYFLFVGVLRYYKGLRYLVEAASLIRAPIVIAGTGPEEAWLKAQVARLGVRNVIFADQVTDHEKVALIMGCRALVLPSNLRSEAYGMVLVEASMYGRAMVTCEIGTGTSFVNHHGNTGLVVPPADPSALARAMTALLDDAPLAEQFGRAARRRYEALFSGPSLGKSFTNLYRAVAGRAGSHQLL